MRFSLITSTPTEMYAFNPFINTPAVAPLTMEAFVAPANFDPDAQELNIVKAFASYTDMNKKYIFSVGTSTTTVLPGVTGRSYAYAENGGAYTTIPSGTITWAVGSIKRNVVVIDTASSIIANIPNSSVWAYVSNNCYSLLASNSTSLKYIHLQLLISVTSIGSNAFNGCSNLTGNLTLPNSLTSIGSVAFESCTRLTSISIPNSVTSIGDSAFFNCQNATFNNDNIFLTHISYIGPSAFAICKKLKNIDFTGSTFTSLQYSGGTGFGTFDNCTGLTSITIPNSVTSIGKNAFRSCTRLTSITIPNSVTSIGDSTFESCTGLTSIANGRSIPQTGLTSNTFNNVNKTISLHVPVGSLSAYQATQYWNEFTNIIDDL